MNFTKINMISKSSQGLIGWDDTLFLERFQNFEKVIIRLPVVKHFDEYYRDENENKNILLCQNTKPEEHIKISFILGSHTIFQYYELNFMVCYKCGEYSSEVYRENVKSCNCEDNINFRKIIELESYIEQELNYERTKYMLDKYKYKGPEIINSFKINDIYNMSYDNFKKKNWYYGMSEDLQTLYENVEFGKDNDKYRNYMRLYHDRIIKYYEDSYNN